MSNRNMSLGRNQNSPPNWVGDWLDRVALLPGGARIDASLFAAYPGPVTVTLTALAAVGAVSLTVTAISAAIPSNTSLTFGVPGKFAVTSAAVAAGATAIPVFAIDQALAIGDSAIYSGTTLVQVPSGTLVSRTFAQRAAGAKFHPAINTDEEFFLTANDVPDANTNDEVALVKPTKSFTVKENFLPGWSAMSAALKTIVRANWNTTIGAE
jgi:hypothetical protein